jgi:predicted phosphodiesterase
VRFLILSDIHGNSEALAAVLADCAGEYDEILCCGDLVGYNPNPAEVVDWAQTNCRIVIRGNHDKVVAGLEGIDWFNDVAQTSALWSRRQLSPDQLTWLRDLQPGPCQREACTLFHGAPFDEDYYVLTPDDSRDCFGCLETEVSFFGHTHVQGGFFKRRLHVGRLTSVLRDGCEHTIEIEPDSVFIVNPGSVGQPRDGDPRAAYALFSPEQRIVTLRRIQYPVETTCRKIRDAGLPEALALRLFRGQ